MRIYYYSWGDEDILGSRIEINKDSAELYTIKLEQEGFSSELFLELKINGDIINENNYQEKDEIGTVKCTNIKQFTAKLNPKPEDLFVLN